MLESFGIGGRLQRGKRYARAGQVLSLEIVPGQVRASVQGSRAKPYRVFIETEILTDPEWAGIEDVMASRAVFLARLLSGEMPEEIEEAFVESATTLVPGLGRRPRLRVLVPRLGESVQARRRGLLPDGGSLRRRSLPHLRLARPGQGQLLADLQGATARSGAVSPRRRRSSDVAEPGNFGWPTFDAERRDAARSAEVVSFWGDDEDVSTIEVRPRLAVAADLVLRQLDPSPLGEAAGIVDELRPLYESITRNAVALAFGEESAAD